MWKEFTQEEPARRGWTVATLSLAFIGTVGLAKIMVDVRADDSSVVSGRQSPPDWPIAFTLPSDHRWRLRPASFDRADAASSDGESVAFDGRRLSGGHCLLLVSFQAMSPGTPPEEVASALTDGDLGMAEEIAMGPIDGRMAVMPSGSGGARILAFGCTPEGLAIVVAYVTPRRKGDEARVVRSVCESIAFKEW